MKLTTYLQETFGDSVVPCRIGSSGKLKVTSKQYNTVNSLYLGAFICVHFVGQLN